MPTTRTSCAPGITSSRSKAPARLHNASTALISSERPRTRMQSRRARAWRCSLAQAFRALLVTKSFEDRAALELRPVGKDARLANIARSARTGALCAVGKVVRVTQWVADGHCPAKVCKDSP